MVSSLEMYNTLNEQNKSSVDNNSKFYHVIRGNARSMLKGHDCPDCQAFYKTLDDQQLKNICSRHRCHNKALDTQPGILSINNINNQGVFDETINSNKGAINIGSTNDDEVYGFTTKFKQSLSN